MSASSPIAMRQFVCGIIKILFTPSRYVARTNVRKTSSVTRAPALRKILASPDRIPTTDKGFIRESIHVTIARPCWATPVSSEYLKLFMYSAFAANASANSSCGKLGMGFPFN
ncbi:unannotated protein [freshwater metagenome]|uniref:Unannotated protein n=1 Tax=freshwater metagenome TaxID=449393 RepID=A0A6J7W8R7_9ZZZZ